MVFTGTVGDGSNPKSFCGSRIIHAMALTSAANLGDGTACRVGPPTSLSPSPGSTALQRPKEGLELAPIGLGTIDRGGEQRRPDLSGAGGADLPLSAVKG